MSNISKYKNGWLLWLFILIGIVLGGLIAELTASVHALKITIASIIGVILAIIIYRFI